jgi:hypothetical protein
LDFSSGEMSAVIHRLQTTGAIWNYRDPDNPVSPWDASCSPHGVAFRRPFIGSHIVSIDGSSTFAVADIDTILVHLQCVSAAHPTSILCALTVRLTERLRRADVTPMHGEHETATSSTEAELMPSVLSAKPTKYLRSPPLGPPETVTPMHGGHEAAIAMINESRATARSRRIDIQHLAIQEWRARCIINPADQFTKAPGWTQRSRRAHRALGHVRPV